MASRLYPPPPSPLIPLPTRHAFQKRIPRVLRAPHHLPPPFPVWPKIRRSTGQGAGDYPPASPLILRPVTHQIPAPSGRQHQSHGDEATRAFPDRPAEWRVYSWAFTALRTGRTAIAAIKRRTGPCSKWKYCSHQRLPGPEPWQPFIIIVNA